MRTEVSGAYVIGVGQTFTSTNDQEAFYLQDSSWITILGNLVVQSSLIGAAAMAAYGWANDSMTIGAGGSVTATANSPANIGYGFYSAWGPGSFTNNGTLSVSGPAATGVYFGGDPTANSVNAFANTGAITVTSTSTDATGLMAVTAVTGSNSGSINVSGVYATGVVLESGGTFTNTATGTITASTVNSSSVGIKAGNQLGGAVTIINSGTVTGYYSIEDDLGTGHMVIRNSGALNGAVRFDANSGNQLYNTGSINGAVLFAGAGSGLYDGRGGTQNGGINLAAGAYTVYLGNDGETVSSGGTGSAVIYGGTGNDTIAGPTGANFISGGGGNDILTGGTGADTFAMRAPSGSVTITDFSHAQGDKIDLSALGSYSWSDIQAASTSGSNTVITLGALTITLQGVASLQQSDVVLGTINLLPTDDFAIDPSVTISAASGPLANFTGAGGTLINKGSMSLTIAGGTGLNVGVNSSVGGNTTATFENDSVFSVTAANAIGVNFAVGLNNSGTFTVEATTGAGFGAMGDVVNSGAMTVLADHGQAFGASDSNLGGVFQNQASGTVSVTSSTTKAYGVLLSHGQDFENAGHLTVTGAAQSVGLYYVAYSGSNSITNSGTISVTDPSSTGYGIRVQNLDGVSSVLTVQNSGTITAADAIDINQIAAHITNSNTINGAVTLAGAGSVLDSHAGTINGVVNLSADAAVILGGENNTVSITGGADAVDGGGGTNTLSYAGAASSVHVSLALQGQAQDSGIGSETLANFQNLIGSTHNDTLTGGTGTNSLTGGAGVDTFVFAVGDGSETITDFTRADGDKIDLSAFHGIHSMSQLLHDASASGSNTLITLGGGTTVTLDGVSLASLQASDFIFGAAPSSTTQNTFDAGPTSAVAFRDASSGDWGYMTVDGSGAELWHGIGPTSTDYAVIAKGDFNGDGMADIAFRNNASGQWGYMSVNPAGGETWRDVGPTSLAYDSLGSGDFNGDGRADIAFRNAATGAWGFMTSNASGGQTWRDVGATSTAYAAVGIGDFDGSGSSEIAFRNNATGDFGYMSVDGSGVEHWHAIGPTGSTYAAIGFGDFNGDGLLDVAFREKTTGDWGFMTINPTGGETWHGVGAASTAYAVIGAADYNGDGMTDIAFRNSSGDWGFMSVDGAGHEIWHGVGPTSMAYTPL